MVNSPSVTGTQRDVPVGYYHRIKYSVAVKNHNEYMCSVTWESVQNVYC